MEEKQGVLKQQPGEQLEQGEQGEPQRAGILEAGGIPEMEGREKEAGGMEGAPRKPQMQGHSAPSMSIESIESIESSKPSVLRRLLEKTGVAGFTLVEIMIVVAVIALLAAIAVPNFLRARKRTQASRILEDLRLIDSALDQYAIEFNKAAGATVPWDAIKQYLKPNSSLFNTGVSVIGGDYTGAAYTVDGAISTPPGTAAALGDVAPADFWTPFQLQ
jgi:prepilin-type N-terminal cleavage/methylation domain-containing protein